MTRRVYIAGHRGLVGGALSRSLENRADVELVHSDQQLDLRREDEAKAAIASARPDALLLVAGRVGGLAANLADPVGFLEDNLAIQRSVMRAALAAGVERLLFIGSANAYPRDAPQPIVEDALGSGPIDPQTEPYGLAKFVGVRQCEAYRRQHGVVWHSAMPCGLYGIGDSFDPVSAHVVPATLRRFADAMEVGASSVQVWGSGRQRRQLMYADDLAAACLLLLEQAEPPSLVNVGPLGDTSIATLSELAARVVGYRGAIDFDTTRPEGVQRRELDTTLIRSLGWAPTTPLSDGLAATWRWYCEQESPTPPPEGART